MKKWYESEEAENGIVISSRIRLARNLKELPFTIKMKETTTEKLMGEIRDSIKQELDSTETMFEFVEVEKLNGNEKLSMMEKHIISPNMVGKKQPCGVFISREQTQSILLNEEDHIRIQTIQAGKEIDKAWRLADNLDNLIEEKQEYAFDEKYGYLTSCPTNVGTGLRASYMMHLFGLEKTGQLSNIMQAIAKFGITVRGIYGEGTEAMGSIYQISNQVTLGQSEKEIIYNLKNVSNLVMEQEERMREKLLKENGAFVEDQMYRAYGILSHARTISAGEAMEYLSAIREGYLLGILKEPKPKINIYDMMIHIQQGCIQSEFAVNSQEKRDYARAEYIRSQL